MTLPDPYTKIVLSEEDLRTIARVVINWGHAESAISIALLKAYNLDQERANDLIHSLNMSRKLNLLLRLNRLGKLPAAVDHFVKEVKYAQENFKHVRNIFSHGMVLADEAGNWSALTPKFQKADPQDLSLALEQSKYVGLMANRVLMAVFGFPIPAQVFERPPIAAK